MMNKLRIVIDLYKLRDQLGIRKDAVFSGIEGNIEDVMDTGKISIIFQHPDAVENTLASMVSKMGFKLIDDRDKLKDALSNVRRLPKDTNESGDIQGKLLEIRRGNS